MANKDFLQQVSDLIIKTDRDSKEWVKSRPLRTTWYMFFLWGILQSVLSFVIIVFPFEETFPKTDVWVIRGPQFGMILIWLILWFLLTFYYFKYTIEQGHPIKFESILIFYFAMVVIFSALYLYTFYLSPNLFQYNSLYVNWSPALAPRTPESWSTRIHFVLYSALESIGSKSTYIESNSIVVSVLNYAQTLYCFSLVSLLIAGYVNQKTNKPA